MKFELQQQLFEVGHAPFLRKLEKRPFNWSEFFCVEIPDQEKLNIFGGELSERYNYFLWVFVEINSL